ncbi:MAG: hypothetical protein WDZ49_04045 [Litorilinea sp.]
MFCTCGHIWQRNRPGRPRRVGGILLGLAVWLMLAACMPVQPKPSAASPIGDSSSPPTVDARVPTPTAVEALYQIWIGNPEGEGNFADAPPPAELLNDFGIGLPHPMPGRPEIPNCLHP